MARLFSLPPAVRSRLSWGLVTLVGLGLFFPGLGVPGLMDPDEGRYAEIAREMLLLRDWLIPHLNLVPYLEKPPLVYWLTAMSLGAFGLGEWAARLPSALAALAGLYLAFWLGRALWGERQGLWGAVVLATSGGYLVLARLLTLDMVFTLFLNLGIALGYLALSRERPRLWPWAYLALALAVLVKGPVALVLAGLIWGLAAALERGWQGLRALIRPGSWAILAAVVLPWFVYAAWRYPAFPRFFLWEHHVERYVSGAGFHAEPWWYFGPVLAGLLLPWTGLIPWALGQKDAAHRGDRLFLMIWAGAVVAFFSLSQGKLATYILPALMPLALLAGKALAEFISGEAGSCQARGLRISLLVWTCVGWLLVGLYGWRPGMLAQLLKQGDFLAPWLLVSLVILALTPLAALALRRPAVLVAGALLLGLILPLGMNRIAVQRSPKAVGADPQGALAARGGAGGGVSLLPGVELLQRPDFSPAGFSHGTEFRGEAGPGERPVFPELG